ncbi:MAG: hypothetical protein MHM6MM_002025 [Cercozoa sp. M6MM]
MWGLLPRALRSMHLRQLTDADFSISEAECQGWRASQEDTSICALFRGWRVLGVFDGHAGDSCSKFAAANFVSKMTQVAESDESLELTQSEFWNKVFLSLDDDFRHACPPSKRGGSTAVIVALKRTERKLTVVIAYVGDSFVALLQRNEATGGESVRLVTPPHKPQDEEEKERIESAGGLVINGRVDGVLAVSRALGDFEFKQAHSSGLTKVSAEPTVTVSHYLIDQPSDGSSDHATDHSTTDGKTDGAGTDSELPRLTGLLIGCDGFLEQLQPSQLRVDESLHRHERFDRSLRSLLTRHRHDQNNVLDLSDDGFGDSVRRLVERSIAAGSRDNHTVMLVRFRAEDTRRRLRELPHVARQLQRPKYRYIRADRFATVEHEAERLGANFLLALACDLERAASRTALFRHCDGVTDCKHDDTDGINTDGIVNGFDSDTISDSDTGETSLATLRSDSDKYHRMAEKMLADRQRHFRECSAPQGGRMQFQDLSNYNGWKKTSAYVCLVVSLAASAWLVRHPLDEGDVARSLCLATCLLIDGVLYLLSLLHGNVFLIDLYWTLTPLFSLLCCVWHPLSQLHVFPSVPVRVLLATVLLLLWSARLTHNYLRREQFLLGAREDFRFQRFRTFLGPRCFALAQLPLAFANQHGLLFGMCVPLAYLVQHPDQSMSLFDYASAAAALAGILISMEADNTLRNWSAQNSNPRLVCRVGLWKYSRHPNYFGEALFWWSMCLLCAYNIGASVYYLLGPLALTLLFLFGSGPLTEYFMMQKRIRRQAYDEYRRTTSFFVPMPTLAQLAKLLPGTAGVEAGSANGTPRTVKKNT